MLAAVMAAAVAGTAAAAALGMAHAAADPRVPPVAPAWLGRLAAQVARVDGDATPGSARWTLTTERAAAPLVGLTAATAPDDARVYVVVLTGHFVAENVSFPAGASAPTGAWIVFTVDARDRTIRDFGIGGPVGTSSVGPLKPLALP